MNNDNLFEILKKKKNIEKWCTPDEMTFYRISIIGWLTLSLKSSAGQAMTNKCNMPVNIRGRN